MYVNNAAVSSPLATSFTSAKVGSTVTINWPTTPEAALVAFTVTVPTPAAVSSPFTSIVAVPVIFITDHVTALFVAFIGVTAALICNVSPFTTVVALLAPVTLIVLTAIL